MAAGITWSPALIDDGTADGSKKMNSDVQSAKLTANSQQNSVKLIGLV